MKHNQFFQTKSNFNIMLLAALVIFIITACSSGVEAPPAVEPSSLGQKAQAEAGAGDDVFVEREVAAEQALAEPGAAAEAEGGNSTASFGQVSNVPNVYDRLIIKNAELELMVEETDTAINRALGIVTEYRGYVVSNRTWFGDGLKYATLTVGVPAENFEEMLRRLKDLAINVSNENISGQDVTDEFVDLEARLRNLEATADRIRDFMDKARDVDESLRVSAQLTEIEAQIEQVKGRMVYLKDRAAFSTITLQIRPQPPVPELTPTPTPVPWSVNHSIDRATGVTGRLSSALFRIGFEVVVWLVVVILPFLLPVAGLLWAAVWVARRLSGGSALHPPSS